MDRFGYGWEGRGYEDTWNFNHIRKAISTVSNQQVMKTQVSMDDFIWFQILHSHCYVFGPIIISAVGCIERERRRGEGTTGNQQ